MYTPYTKLLAIEVLSLGETVKMLCLNIPAGISAIAKSLKGVLVKYAVLIAISGLLIGCANITPAGSQVKIVEEEGTLLHMSETADKMVAKQNCSFIGFVDAKTSVFPGSYSLHDNEVHTALRNRAAKMGANVVIANFYRKPAQGIGLKCPDDV